MPLNTASMSSSDSALIVADPGTIVSALAFENIEAAGIMNKHVALEFTALKGSLGLMSKVLSDILDLYAISGCLACLLTSSVF